MSPKVKAQVEVNPKRLPGKVEQIKFKLKKEIVVNIDASLKRIYSITN